MKITVEKANKLAKICRVELQSKQFFTPIFFPSLSSTEVDYQKHYNWLLKQKPEIFMSSAYDLNQKKLKQISNLNAITCLDSGGFELKKNEKNTSWTIEDQIKIIEKMNFHIIITLDFPIHKKEGKYFSIRNEILINNYKIIEQIVGKKSLICFSFTENKKFLINQIESILSQINPKAVAIPESHLGVNFVERKEMLCSIKNTINQLSNNEVLLHIRGCSDPDLIIQYVQNGADIFDGLGWTRKVIKWFEFDKKNNFDIENKWHIEFDLGKLSDCDCKGCKRAKRGDYLDRLFKHNNFAYRKLINDVHEQIKS